MHPDPKSAAAGDPPPGWVTDLQGCNARCRAWLRSSRWGAVGWSNGALAEPGIAAAGSGRQAGNPRKFQGGARDGASGIARVRRWGSQPAGPPAGLGRCTARAGRGYQGWCATYGVTYPSTATATATATATTALVSAFTRSRLAGCYPPSQSYDNDIPAAATALYHLRPYLHRSKERPPHTGILPSPPVPSPLTHRGGYVFQPSPPSH
jgi:hypothetical protein